MTSQDLVQRVVHEELLAGGFRRVRNMYYKSGGMLVLAVHLLRSRFGPSYYLDLYANFLAVDPNPTPSQAAQIQLRADILLSRLDALPVGMNRLFSLNATMDDELRVSAIRSVMKELIRAFDPVLSASDLHDPALRQFVDLALVRGNAQDYLASHNVPWREEPLGMRND